MSRIAMIPGEGIGPEIAAEATKVLAAVQERSGLDLQIVPFERLPLLSEQLLREFRQDYEAIFIGALTTSRAGGAQPPRAWLNTLIRSLELYLHHSHIKLLCARYCPLKDKKEDDVDFVILGDNGEGADNEFSGSYKKDSTDEVAWRQIFTTRRGAERFIRHGFEFARRRGLKHVTLSIKNSRSPGEDGLKERVFGEIRQGYAELEGAVIEVNNLLAQILKTPERFDVILSDHLYDDVIADVGTQLIGGLGLGAAADLHPGKTSLFMAAPQPGINRAGQNLANPLGAIGAAALMLEHLGFEQEANWVQCARQHALETGNITHDLGGRLGAREVGDFVAQQIRKGAC